MAKSLIDYLKTDFFERSFFFFIVFILFVLKTETDILPLKMFQVSNTIKRLFNQTTLLFSFL